MYLMDGLFLTWTRKSLSLQIIYYNIYTSFTAPFNPTPCFQPSHVYLLGEPTSLLVVANIHPLLPLVCQQLPHPLLVLPPFHTPQIQLQYLHRRHQQLLPSSSGTVLYILYIFIVLVYSKKLQLGMSYYLDCIHCVEKCILHILSWRGAVGPDADARVFNTFLNQKGLRRHGLQQSNFFSSLPSVYMYSTLFKALGKTSFKVLISCMQRNVTIHIVQHFTFATM